MTKSPENIDPGPRESSWAKPVEHLHAPDTPDNAVNINVEGRKVIGPVQGFGQLWQKTYQVRLHRKQLSADEVVRIWKERFPKLWPKGNRFYGSAEGINPGSVAVLNLAGPPGMPMISTGIFVVYADESSFTFMTPEGHMFAGIITFSADENEDGSVIAQVQALLRANDPLYELGLRLGVGHKAEDNFWRTILQNLAAVFDSHERVRQQTICLDSHMQWKRAGNIWKNAAVRTMFYNVAAPIRLLRRKK